MYYVGIAKKQGELVTEKNTDLLRMKLIAYCI